MNEARRLVIATKNKKKLYELRRYLEGIKAGIVSMHDFDRTPRIVENEDTFRKNAVKKALVVSRFVSGLALADDSGLEVNILGGKPGVRSSRFAGPSKNDKKNNEKLLRLLKKVPLKRRHARFVCAVAVADNGRLVKVIEENCKGLIAFSPKGPYGFGYDPVFLIPGYKKTFGELGLAVKDKMSHRSKALKKAREFLKGYLSGRSAAG